MPEQENLIEAFEHMLEDVNNSIHQAESALAPSIDEMILNAQILARELYSLTQEEAEGLSYSLKRDLHKANIVINQQSKEIGDWLSFDFKLAENKFLELVANAADKSWLEFHALDQLNHESNIYRCSEVCAPGTFT
ncbi:MAG: hypothetical protein ACI822_000807, partial [Gammaproteobacteria bacterium]